MMPSDGTGGAVPGADGHESVLAESPGSDAGWWATSGPRIRINSLDLVRSLGYHAGGSRRTTAMRFRVSITGLMASVLFAGVGFAALTNPSETWAIALFTPTVGALTV